MQYMQIVSYAKYLITVCKYSIEILKLYKNNFMEQLKRSKL